MKIPITKPFFGEEEKKAIVEPLESVWIMQGRFIRPFDEQCLKPLSKLISCYPKVLARQRQTSLSREPEIPRPNGLETRMNRMYSWHTNEYYFVSKFDLLVDVEPVGSR